MSPTVVVLAGGASRRMGRDKSLIEIDGVTMLERMVASARGAGLEVAVAGRAPMPSVVGVSAWIADEAPGAGPLAALASVLRRLEREIILVAVDMPLVDGEAFTWLASLSMADDSDALVIRNRGRLEPLFARYRPSCLPIAQDLIATDRPALRELLASVRTKVVDAPQWLVPKLANVNTPEDVEDLERSNEH